jgi:hypothetical protein
LKQLFVSKTLTLVPANDLYLFLSEKKVPKKTLFRQYEMGFWDLCSVVIAGEGGSNTPVLSFGTGNIRFGPSDRGFSEKS